MLERRKEQERMIGFGSISRSSKNEDRRNKNITYKSITIGRNDFNLNEKDFLRIIVRRRATIAEDGGHRGRVSRYFLSSRREFFPVGIVV